MIDQVSSAIPAADSSAPSGSNRPAFGSRDSGSSSRPATSAMTTTGTLTRRTPSDQEKCRSSAPPDTGPIATARPDTADQMPIAVARSRGLVNTLLRIASVAG